MHTSSRIPLLRFLAPVFLTLAMTACSTPSLRTATVDARDNRILFSGRSDGIGTGDVALGYSGARVRLHFRGTSVAARLNDERGENYAVAFIDGKMGTKFRLNRTDGLYPLAANLPEGEHTVELVRITECDSGLTHFKGFVLSAGAAVLDWPKAPARKIEIIGDSITCGYGVEANDPNLHFSYETENFCLGYAGRTVRALNADYLIVSRSGIGILRDYDGPREGSEVTMPGEYPQTFYMRPSPKWDFTRFTPDVVCINLGTNDFSTTGCNVDKYVSRYIDFAGKILERYPDAKLVLLQGPMDTSDALHGALDKVLAALQAKAPGRVTYFRFSGMLPDGLGADYHPNVKQAELNAGELEGYLRELMGWK